jgi:hypothetical protein
MTKGRVPMIPMRKWFNLPARERRLVLRALPWVVAARVALWVLPWRWTLGLTRRLSTPRARRAPGTVDEVVRAVVRAAGGVPRATCLTRAIVASVMLGRRGMPASIRFGVARDVAGKFIAHAWVESGGRIVIGGSTSPRRYASFPPVAVSADVRTGVLANP